MEKYCQDNGFMGWFETSAKDNVNIEKAAVFLVEKMLEHTRGPGSGNNQDPKQINLTNTPKQPEKGCCG